MKAIRTIIILIILAAVGFVAYKWYASPEATNVMMQDARITDVSPMLRLCSVEIYDDVPVKESIGNRHLFARVALKGSISFDLDSVSMTENGDTLSFALPHEIVEVYESTDADSYQVIDVWCDSFFGSSNFTTAEENAIKSKVRDNYRKNIYQKGYVSRARKEAVANLTSLLSGLTGKTVIVTDPSPEGYLN
ncbi:MAG: DUF4230 domain-containing protein [Muribaculaceae bacterium]|nr:DUF4230 domain-containing protein [Muribaculaceae bacterium]